MKLLQRYKLKMGHIWWKLNPRQQYLVRAGGKCYNVTIHFEMCMVDFNIASEVVTALQAENGTYMLGLKPWQK